MSDYKQVILDTTGALITFSKPGYFPQFDRVYPQGNGHYFSEKIMLRKVSAGTISGIDGGAVAVGDASVTLPRRAAAYPGGPTYEGPMEVLAQWIAPDATDLGPAMPASLLGLQEDGTTTTLTTYGILSVELASAGGEQLQIANGKAAELIIPIPPHLQGQAPGELPLWHFDEGAGIWIEEGIATRSGNTYIAPVTHFSIWAIHFPSGTPAAPFSGCLAYGTEEPAVFHTFEIHDPSGQFLVYGKTDAAGRFSGPLPTGVPANLYADLPCGGAAQFAIDPISESTALTDCYTITSQDPITLSGRLVDCDGQALASSMLELDFGDRVQYALTDNTGRFTFYTGCSSGESAQLVGYDVPNGTSSEPTQYVLSEDLEIGTLFACTPPDEYVTVSVDLLTGVQFTFVLAELNHDNPEPPSFHIGCEGGDQDGNSHFLNLGFPALEVGTYTNEAVQAIYSFVPDLTFQHRRIRAGCAVEQCSDLTVEITLNEGPGGFVEGQFSGVVDGEDNLTGNSIPLENIPISGEFRLAW